MLENSSLEPFDHNYTLEGLARHIEVELSELITHKKQHRNDQEPREEA